MKPCKCCGKPISPRKRNPSRPIVYCSARCQNDWQNQDKIKRWLAGRYNGTRGEQLQLSQTIRNYILNTRGHKCARCGWKKKHPTTGRIPVQVHHIDGNATNTKPANLEVLCPNCHALTPNWGAANRGSGRTTTHRRMTSGKR